MAHDDELLSTKLFEAHRAVGVELGRRDPKFRAKAKLAAIVETGGCVDEDAAGVDLS